MSYKNLDPLCVDAGRKRALRCCLYYDKGVNRVWNVNGYDKFKLFGFEIHGRIDGYGRCVFWLNILRSNKDPNATLSLIAWILLKEFHWKLHWSRTKNILIKGSQRYFRRNHDHNLVEHLKMLSGKSRLLGTFLYTSSQWHIQQHRIFTSRVLQICTFSDDWKGTKGYQRP